MTTLDLDFVRSQFYAFSEPSLAGWAFFENAGGSYACKQVTDRLTSYYRETKVQPYGPYPASAKAGAGMDEAYQRLSEYLNVERDEIHIGPSTTQNVYVLAHAFGDMMEAGDEIIVTNQDHEANSGAWRRMAERGVVVHQWTMNPETGILDPADLDDMMNEKTRLVIFPHCSNVVAHINDVAAISAKVHAAGALAVVDGVSYAPHGFPDMQALGADVYMFSMYKTFGPHQGLMVVRRNALEKMGNQSHYFNAGYANKKILPAGPDHGQIMAAAGVAHYFDAIHDHHFSDEVDSAEKGRRVHDLFRDHEKQLLAPLLDWLKHKDGVSIVGPDDAETRAATVAVRTANRAPNFLARELAEHNVMVNSGHFYGVRVLEGMNIPLDPGVLRMSFVHYTSKAEVDQLITALDQLL